MTESKARCWRRPTAWTRTSAYGRTPQRPPTVGGAVISRAQSCSSGSRRVLCWRVHCGRHLRTSRWARRREDSGSASWPPNAPNSSVLTLDCFSITSQLPASYWSPHHRRHAAVSCHRITRRLPHSVPRQGRSRPSDFSAIGRLHRGYTSRGFPGRPPAAAGDCGRYSTGLEHGLHASPCTR